MNYADFMRGMTNAPFDKNLCPICGGLGLKPVMCCNGLECGCHNMPVDFLKCGCGLPEPTEQLILSWVPSIYHDN